MDPRLVGNSSSGYDSQYHQHAWQQQQQQLQLQQQQQQHYYEQEMSYYNQDGSSGNYYQGSSSGNYYQDGSGGHHYSNYQQPDTQAYYRNQQQYDDMIYSQTAVQANYALPAPSLHIPSPPATHVFQLPSLPKNSITSIQSSAPSLEDINLDTICVGKMVNILKKAIKDGRGRVYHPVDVSKMTAKS